MNISVELFGQLSPLSPQRQTLDLATDATVQDVAVMLGLDPEQIGLITINGVQSEMEDSVDPGSRVCFFPHMSGG